MNEQCVGWFATRASARWGDREFAEFDGRRISFAELSTWVDRVAADLVGHGIEPGDRVLVQLPNCLEVIVLQLAALRIGAVAVPVVSIYREHEVKQIVADCRPQAVATVDDLRGRRLGEELERCLETAGIETGVRYMLEGSRQGWSEFPSLAGAEPARGDLPEPADPGNCCLILYTSGTTSAPKGVMLSSSALIAATAAWERLALGPEDVALAVAPLAHIAGMVPGCLVPLTVGSRVTIMPRWDADEAVRVIERERVTFSTGANVFLKDLVEAYERQPSTHKPNHFVSGGSATPPELVERATALGLGAVRAYGMTETAGVISMAEHDAPLERKACFDGRLIDSVEMRVVDAEGNDLPPGSEGTLLIRGPQLMLGYTDPEVNELQFRDGWFDPGDIGAVDAERWLRITGRTKEIINRGGEKFSVRDIEEAILRHPDVNDAAVIPVPDERFGETVGAFVVIRDGCVPPALAEVSELLLEEGLAKAKLPVAWHTIERIPTTPSGKVKRFELIEMHERALVAEGSSRNG